MPVSNISKSAQVRDAHPRVRRALCVDEPSALRDVLLHGCHIRGVDEDHIDAGEDAVLSEEAVHTTVDVLVHNDLITTSEEPHYSVQCSHSRGEGEGHCRLVEHRHLLLQSCSRRIPRSRIIVGAELAAGRLHKGGRLVDGRIRRVVGVLRAAIEDHTLGGRTQLVLEVRKVWPYGESREIIVPDRRSPCRKPELTLCEGILQTLEEDLVKLFVVAGFVLITPNEAGEAAARHHLVNPREVAARHGLFGTALWTLGLLLFHVQQSPARVLQAARIHIAALSSLGSVLRPTFPPDRGHDDSSITA
mmetsp:Transcript_94290/g.202398  ORF Transcript_94290/g.202398 Transcript_94290/m.202398 type:complete len:304 (+) Transcript_94290:1165-2076(+)